MQHVGNDIVDLTNPSTRRKSQDIRFINRVFTQGEQKQILSSANPDVMLWALWAGKEAAYKVVSKSYPAVPSVPRAYNVSFDEDVIQLSRNCSGCYIISGAVRTPRGLILIKAFQTHDSIHCIGVSGSPEGVDSVIWGVKRISKSLNAPPYFESSAVREAAKRHLSLYLNRKPDEIEIHRPRGARGLGVPIVYVNDCHAGVDISLSHEGEFVAYAFATGSFS